MDGFKSDWSRCWAAAAAFAVLTAGALFVACQEEKTRSDAPDRADDKRDAPTSLGAKLAHEARVTTEQLAAARRERERRLADDPFRAERDGMVRQDIAAGDAWGRDAVTDQTVLDAMRRTPRHEFVDRGQRAQAYADYPLPIGHGQTISQPYIVAYMTEMLRLGADAVALEIGTGSGYQAAVLGEIAREVYTIEIVEPLAETAAKRLKELRYPNVHVKSGDGYYGWPEHAPFDAIIVTAAASHIPPPLVEQLKPGGRMAIPVGPPFQIQNLMLIEKRADGSVRQQSVMPVRFVPLTGGGK